MTRTRLESQLAECRYPFSQVTSTTSSPPFTPPPSKTMMPSDEYKTVAGGGLKLKGSKPSGVGKTKKKKKPKAEGSAKLENALAEVERKDVAKNENEEKMASDGEDLNETKTPTQRKHEEMKRKRLNERLEREGVKSHKEKVEELNKYLSKLSEHHDMPKIGPG